MSHNNITLHLCHYNNITFYLQRIKDYKDYKLNKDKMKRWMCLNVYVCTHTYTFRHIHPNTAIFCTSFYFHFYWTMTNNDWLIDWLIRMRWEDTHITLLTLHTLTYLSRSVPFSSILKGPDSAQTEASVTFLLIFSSAQSCTSWSTRCVPLALINRRSHQLLKPLSNEPLLLPMVNIHNHPLTPCKWIGQ